MHSKDDEIALSNFISFLKINTISSLGVSTKSYTQAAELLSKQCKEANLQDIKIIEPVKGKPIVLASLPGKDPSKSSVLLTGHYDVVPIDMNKWTVEPFKGLIKDGMIYARGAQDMKCCISGYIEALRRLVNDGFVPERTIHCSFLPDEEIGGKDGMQAFMKTQEFKDFNIGFALDEGLASPDGIVPVYFGERALWWINVKSFGKTGHSSTYHETDTGALEKLLSFCSKAMEFRKRESTKYLEKKQSLGDTITLNLNALKAGHSTDNGASFALNVVPSECFAGFDIRIPPTIDLSQFEAETFKKWLAECNGTEDPAQTKFEMTYERIVGTLSNPSTQIKGNPWWEKLEKTCASLNLEIEPRIFPAATDSRFLRQIGIPCLGFTPVPNTTVLFHDHDERIGVDTFLNAIKVYKHLIVSLSGE